MSPLRTAVRAAALLLAVALPAAAKLPPSRLAYSSDGSRIAIVDFVRSGVRIHDSGTLQELRFLPTQTNIVYDVAFHPHEERLAAVRHRELWVWDLRTGEVVRSLPRQEDVPVAVDYSPDGSTLAIGDFSAPSVLWRPAEGDVLPFSRPHDELWSLVYSADGRRLASGGGQRIILWSPADRSPQLELDGLEGRVRDIALTADGRLVAAATGEPVVDVWDAATGERVLSLEAPEEVWSVAFAPDGRYLATGGDSGHVGLWRLERVELVASFPEHADLLASVQQVFVSSVAFSPDGRSLAAAAFVPGGSSQVEAGAYLAVWPVEDLATAAPGATWGGVKQSAPGRR